MGTDPRTGKVSKELLKEAKEWEGNKVQEKPGNPYWPVIGDLGRQQFKVKKIQESPIGLSSVIWEGKRKQKKAKENKRKKESG